jgi:type III restriction enzyme
MSNQFFEHPILNSPYEYPREHWELDAEGQPTGKTIQSRREVRFITPVPKPRKHKGSRKQAEIVFDEGKGLSTPEQQYDPTPIINELRHHVDQWRSLPNPNDWNVTPETVRLLQHWRHHQFTGIRPFFCQIEAVEVAIWLTEVAPAIGKTGTKFLDHLANANNDANPGLMRLALKLATGSGKTTVMAMIIAWQTINAVRRPGSKKFTRGFLVVAPGLPVRDRLRVLQPNDPDSYYQSRELVPNDLLADLDRAKIVITNYHAFKLRENLELSSGGRALLQGRGAELKTLETEGQMIQRVMPELMGIKNILVINDEGHHCYREKPGEANERELTPDDKEEAAKNNEAARLWISGLEIISRKLGIQRIFDLSATPFFLRGSGYAEGTLFPWTMSDFSLMDAIECGIVKLPRVPVADNIPGEDAPLFRNLWEHIRTRMPKKGRGKSGALDPLSLPVELQTALEALYGHYAKTFDLWQEAKIKVPPCFIVVCNNTSASKLVYDYVSGFHRENEDGSTTLENGRLALFRNFDEFGNQLARPRTLLIDSEQLESGDALDEKFRAMAADEIERFRREIVERTGDQHQAENISDQDLLREVMNTVGKQGRLGESIRCVVSVSMLTEGWDANTVTHVLGVRAFGTQLLCEQVIGRALRRQSYDLNENNLFNVEYADVLGIPFDFNAKPVVAPPQLPRETIQVKAVRPDRDHLEITFPRVAGYRVELPEERLTAEFNEDSLLVLTPELVGPSITKNQGIVGKDVDLSLQHLGDMRRSTLVFHVAKRLLYTKWRDPGEEPKLYLFGQLKRITKEWLDTCLVCRGSTFPAQLIYQELADMACERITAAITRATVGKSPIKIIPDPYNPTGSTIHVKFNTSRTDRWETNPRRCHINWIILDSDWEAEFCRVAESHPRVLSYVKNHNLGFEVPYRYGSENRTYRPDFIVLVDDGHGKDDPLHLIVEIKGYRREDAKEKKAAMETYWVPGVNNSGKYGRWAFAEFRDVYEIESDFGLKVEPLFHDMIERCSSSIENVVKHGHEDIVLIGSGQGALHVLARITALPGRAEFAPVALRQILSKLEASLQSLPPNDTNVIGTANEYTASQFGEGGKWRKLSEAIMTRATGAEGSFSLADLDSVSEFASSTADEALAVLTLLSAPSARFLKIEFRSDSPDQPEIAPTEVVRMLTAWWKEKSISDDEWNKWASGVLVRWVPVTDGAFS